MEFELRHLRELILKNTCPIYFIDWCLYTALGMEEYIGNLQFICATDNFYGKHPNIFAPKSFQYNHALSSEETLNLLLQNPEVRSHIQKRGTGKLLTWLFDEETERLAKGLDLEICLPTAQLRYKWDHKVNATRLAEKAGVPCVPNIISSILNYTHLRDISVKLGNNLVVQMPHGLGGETTFFISTEDDFNKHQNLICNGEEMKIAKHINCRGASLEACVTKHGIVVTPLLVELYGQPEVSIYKGGWCGDEFFPNAFPGSIIRNAKDYTEKLGEALRTVGYKGYFQPDFLIDEETDTLYLSEMNLRFSGFTSLVNNSNQAREDIPLLLLHLAEWLNVDYKLDIQSLNEKWIQQSNVKTISYLHVKNIKEDLAKPIPTGIYRMNRDGKLYYDRFACNPAALQSENEIFWVSTSAEHSKIKRGDEIGSIFIRSRITSDGKFLNNNIKLWLKELLNQEKDAC